VLGLHARHGGEEAFFRREIDTDGRGYK